MLKFVLIIGLERRSYERSNSFYHLKGHSLFRMSVLQSNISPPEISPKFSGKLSLSVAYNYLNKHFNFEILKFTDYLKKKMMDRDKKSVSNAHRKIRVKNLFMKKIILIQIIKDR